MTPPRIFYLGLFARLRKTRSCGAYTAPLGLSSDPQLPGRNPGTYHYTEATAERPWQRIKPFGLRLQELRLSASCTIYPLRHVYAGSSWRVETPNQQGELALTRHGASVRPLKLT
jgi:hypothetical protein